MKIKDILRFYREKENLTRENLADKTFLSVKTIEKYETERVPSVEKLEILAKALNIPVSRFFNIKKVKEDMRKFRIKEVNATITKEEDEDKPGEFFYWVEIDAAATREILEELTSDCFNTLEEAEDYLETHIESKYEVLNYHLKDLTD